MSAEVAKELGSILSEINGNTKALNDFIKDQRKSYVTISLSRLSKISSTKVKFDVESPDYSLKNDTGIPLKIQSISLIPDDNFKTSGICAIRCNRNKFFDTESAGDFAKVNELVLYNQQGMLLPKNTSVDVFIFNGN